MTSSLIRGLATLALIAVAPAAAQMPAKASVAEVALYQGADRSQRLIEGARRGFSRSTPRPRSRTGEAGFHGDQP